MRTLHTIAPAALAAALLVPGAAVAGVSPGTAGTAPPATVAGDGGGGPLIYPAIVNTRLVRAQAALGRAIAAVDNGQSLPAAAQVAVASSHLTGAWLGAKYVIQTTPPAPPAADDGVAAGTAASSAAYAGPQDTAMAVFEAEHDLITAAIGMIETNNATLRNRLSAAISAMQRDRQDAIAYIHTSAPVPPPAADDGVAAGAPVGSAWGQTMPQLVPVLDDEIQQIKGRLALSKFTAVATSVLTKARLKASDQKDLVNQYWPPLPADD